MMPPGAIEPQDPDKPPPMMMLPNAVGLDMQPQPGPHNNEKPHAAPARTREAHRKVLIQPSHGAHHEGLSSEAEGDGEPRPQLDMEAWLRSLDGKLDYITKAVREMREDRRAPRQSVALKSAQALHLQGKKWDSQNSRAQTPVSNAVRSQTPVRAATAGSGRAATAGSTGLERMAKRLAKAHAALRAGAAAQQGEDRAETIVAPTAWNGNEKERKQLSGASPSSAHCSPAAPPAEDASAQVRGQDDAGSDDPEEARADSSTSKSSWLFPAREGSVFRKMTVIGWGRRGTGMSKRSFCSNRSTNRFSRGSLSRFAKVKSLMGIFEEDEEEKSSGSEVSKQLTTKELMMQANISRQLTRMNNQDVMKNIVKHRLFELTIMFAVLLNALTIGTQTQLMASSTGDAPTDGWLLDLLATLDDACTIIFILELAARIFAFKRDFYTNPEERNWNIFDTLLVLASIADVIISSAVGTYRGLSDLSLGKTARVLRMARLVRILRTVRFVSELRVMVQMIATSLQSLLWILVILFMVIYFVSIILTTGATEYLRAERDERPSSYQAINSNFGGIFKTMYTLYKAMSGGVDWGDLSMLLREIDWFYEAVLVCYTFFTIFAVINIVTGVFVDGAIEVAKRDRTMIMQKRDKEQKTHEADMLALMHIMGMDGDRSMGKEEFKEALEREEVKEFISAMHVDVSDAAAFFNLLDTSGDGMVDISEFVSGMSKLSGEAKSVDVAMMMLENRKMLKSVAILVELLGETFDDGEASESAFCSSSYNGEDVNYM